jgi:hypothetical protein
MTSRRATLTLEFRVRYVAKVAAITVLLAPASAAAQDHAFLARHAPILRYDSAETDRATAVEALTDRRLGATGRPTDRVALRGRSTPLPDTVYGRAVPVTGGRTWLQYWMLYADNPQDRGIVRTGRHEGDWEVVQVLLDARRRPRTVVYAQHRWAGACAWPAVEHRAGAPVVYVANGSHGSYARAGEHGRPWPDPDDEADGRGRTVRPDVVPIGDRAPGWVRWPGRWGRSTGGIVPGAMESPRGPAFQAPGPWADPDAYAARARACDAGAPPLPAGALVAAALGAAAVAAVAGSALTRRRRARRA